MNITSIRVLPALIGTAPRDHIHDEHVAEGRDQGGDGLTIDFVFGVEAVEADLAALPREVARQQPDAFGGLK